MPPKAQAKTTETAEAKDVLGADASSMPKAGKAAPEHDPKVEVEKSELPELPPRTSGALPVTVPVADSLDEGVTTATVMIQHPVYGQISLSDLEEVIRADVEARQRTEQHEKDARLPELCEEHFPQGWDSPHAAEQDGVGCEHGSWSRKSRAKSSEISFPESWKASGKLAEGKE